MKCVALATIALGVIIGSSEAIKLEKRSDAPTVVHLPIERRSIQNPVERDQHRRRKRELKTVTQTLDNFQVRILVSHF